MHRGGRFRARRAALWLAFITPWLGAGECTEEVVQLDSVMRVEPAAIDYGVVAIATDVAVPIRVSNPSAIDLALTVQLSDATDPAFSFDPAPALVIAGSSVEIPVHFRPRLPTQVTGTVVLTSDSQAYPRAEVALVGSGIDQGLPDIVVVPAEVDFGATGLDAVVRRGALVRNTGIRDLILDEVTLDDSGSNAFRLVTSAPPGYLLTPGAEVTLQLAFSPPSLGEHSGHLTLRSNDPDESVLGVSLTGLGYDVPVAVLAALDDISALEPLDAVRLDGSGSYSPTPGVDIDSYEYHLTLRPQGSTTVLRAGGEAGIDLLVPGPRADLLLDLAGRYEVALHVLDSRGVRSASASVLRVRAVPDEDLHVQLVWDHPTADLDLHYVRHRDSIFDHGSDCYFSNAFPAWYPDTPDANPRLDVDDRDGFGPENVNVPRPAAGVKVLYVHYWSARTTGNTETTALVRVFVRGQLAAEVSRAFQDEERLWSALEIVWPEDPDGPVALNPLGAVVDYRRPF